MLCEDCSQHGKEDGSSVTLNVCGVSFGYTSEDTLKKIDITANKGEFIALMGPNGSGKTTLLRCINKLLAIREGDIQLGESNIRLMTMLEIARICTTVPADTPLDFSLTTKDFVTLGRSPYIKNWWWEDPEDEQKVDSAMREFDILKYADRRLNQLSSGERARALLAKGVVQEPKVMLVDEPSAHLDIKYKIQVMEMLRDLSRRGITVIMASHDINLLTRYCDKIMLLGKGRILNYGAPSEVVTEESIRNIFEVDVTLVNVGGIVYIVPKAPVEGEGPF